MAKKSPVAVVEERVPQQGFWDFDQLADALNTPSAHVTEESTGDFSVGSSGTDDFLPLAGEPTDSFLPPLPEPEKAGDVPLSDGAATPDGDRHGDSAPAGPAGGVADSPLPESLGGSDYAEVDEVPAEGWRARRLREGLGRFYHAPAPAYELPAGVARPTTVDARKAANLAALDTLLLLKKEKRSPTPSEQMALALYTGQEDLNYSTYTAESDPYFKRMAEAKVLGTPRAVNLPPAMTHRLTQMIKRLQPDTTATLLTNSDWLGHLANPDFRNSFRSMVVGSPRNDRMHRQVGEILYPGVFTDQNMDGVDAYPPIFNTVITTVRTGERPNEASKYPLVNAIAPRQMLSALEMTAPGGLVCLVCPPNYFLDSSDQDAVRNGLQALGVLETSYRVEDDNETNDIILFRKYLVGEAPESSGWVMGGRDGYYYDHPDHVQPSGLNPAEAEKWFEDAMAQAPEGYLSGKTRSRAEALAELPMTKLVAGEGSLVEENGRVVRITPSGNARIRWGATDTESRARLLIPVRDAMIHLVNLHQDKADRQALHDQRQELHQAYDRFVTKYGPISKSENIGAFPDTHRHLVLMTECNYNLVDNTADKSEVFTKNIFMHTQTAQKAEDARHAFLLSMRDHNRVDLDYMSKLTRLSHDELLEDLEGQVYLDPKTNQHVPRWEYLSGDLSEKMVRAKLAQGGNPRMAENIRLLNDQMEKDFTDVEVGLGSPVVPLKLIKSFFATFIGVPEDRMSLTYSQTKNRYQISGKKGLKGTAAALKRGQVKKSSEDTKSSVLMIAPLNHTRGVEGVPNAMAHRLLICALHGRVPDIRVKEGDKFVRTPKTIEQTGEAITKIAQMKEDFVAWVKDDPARTEAIRQNYRKSIGGYAKPVYSGEHLNVLPGSNPTIELRPFQKDGAARMIASEASYLAYQVGYGKTFALAAGVMEARRLGLAKRPVIFTMDRLVDNFAIQYKRLYPSARIYTARPSEFVNMPGKNKVADHVPDVLKSIASGSYDVAILSANLLPHLPMGDWTGRYEEQLRRERLTKALFNSEKDSEFDDIQKNIEEIIQKDEVPVAAKGGIAFDNIGVDMVVCDEFDEVGQAIPISTSLNITGLPARDNTTAKKLLSIYDMMRMTGGRVVSASGTPLRNSIAEMWIVNRFHRPDLLVRQQALRFDRWFPTFAGITTQMEVHVDSRTMRMKTRLGPFCNMRDMMLSVSQFADFVNNTNYSLEGLPQLEGGKPEVVTCDSYPALESYIDDLVVRAELSHARKNAPYAVPGPNGRLVHIPKNDNLLAICTEGRKAALDMRMIDADADDHLGNKINECVRRTSEIYHEKSAETATQMIFCELGVESDDPSRFSTYREIKRKLIAEGLPAREIRFAQEFSSTPEHLERAMRSGAIRVLIGNTRSMGAGLNVQDRLYALHHLDVTYCARDLDQREGRIIRPGNRFEFIRIFNYVQKGSFDAVMFEHNSFKRKILLQITSFDLNMNRCDDIDGQTATLEEMKASACRDPILRAAMEKRSAIHHEIQKLTILDRDEMQYALGAKENLAQLDYEMENRNKVIEALRKDVDAFSNDSEFKILLAPLPTSVDDKAQGQKPENYIEFTTKSAASKHLNALLRSYSNGQIGAYRGVPMSITGNNWDIRLGSVVQRADTFGPLESLLSKVTALPDNLRLAEAECEKQKNARQELEKASQQSGKYKGRLGELRREMSQIEVQLGGKTSDIVEVETQIVEEAISDDEKPAAETLSRERNKGASKLAMAAFAREDAVESVPEHVADFAPVPSARLTSQLRGEIVSAMETLGDATSLTEMMPAVTGNFALLSEHPDLLAERRVVVSVAGGMGGLEKISHELMDDRPLGWDNPRWRNGSLVISAVPLGGPLEICLVAGGDSVRAHSDPTGFGLPAVEPAVALAYLQDEARMGRATGASICNLLLHPEVSDDACRLNEGAKGKLRDWLRRQDVSSSVTSAVEECLKPSAPVVTPSGLSRLRSTQDLSQMAALAGPLDGMGK
jgi:N12 class adenine-specific DNA methylase